MTKTAFISFSSRYRGWVRLLYRNLTACLGEGSVLLDEADLGPGRSWVSDLQEGISRAARVVLVASPEAFASPWVFQELESFQALHPNWKAEGRLQVALLVETPLPPFLVSVQHIDFRDHDEKAYREGMEVLVAALRGLRDPRNSRPMPDDLEVPEPPSGGLPTELRSRLVRILSPLFTPRHARTAVATALGLSPERLEGHASAPLAVSAALVLAPSAQSAADKASTVLEVILDQELGDGEPGLTRDLRALLAELADVAPTPVSTSATGRALPKPVPLVHPTGTVPLGSELYVERDSDAAAVREIDRTPGLVHILGPRQSGKSSLITRLADRARNDPTGPLVVSINFQDLDIGTLIDLRTLLVQVAWQVLEAAGRDPETALELGQTPLAPKLACKRLVQVEVLDRHPRGVLIALDETDRVVSPGGCADDFFGMLRSWHETGKQEPTWARLHLALAFSTEAFMVPEGMTQSPLANVGHKCRLHDFQKSEIDELIERHGLTAPGDLCGQLDEWVGGNPYLTRRALYALAVERYEFKNVISEALSGEGPLGEHLSHHLRYLQADPELADAMRRILRHGECPDERRYRSLEGLGLVSRNGKRVIPRYRLYHDFLWERL